MSTPIVKIKGVGPSTAQVLAENGFRCAEDLAAASEDALGKIHGFGPVRAKSVLMAARDLCGHALVGRTPSSLPPADSITTEKPLAVEKQAKVSSIMLRQQDKDPPKKKSKGKKKKKKKEEKKANHDKKTKKDRKIRDKDSKKKKKKKQKKR